MIASSRSVAGVFAAAAALLACLLVLAAPAPAATACPASVGAPSAAVMEVSTGVVACARAADRPRPIASATKLMTALLTLENAKLSAVFTAARYFPPPIESQIGLQPGERMTVRDLLGGLLVESANDAAVTLAEGVGGSRRAFVRAMNRRAQQFGLAHTHYANPIGLDQAGNYSSARDLVRLATILRTKPFFRRTVDKPSITLRSGVRPRTFANRNDLVSQYAWVNGVKSGHTRQAGYVLVGSGRRPRDGIQLVTAVLGTSSVAARDSDTLALLKWGFERFQRIRAVQRGQTLASVPIRFRRGAELNLVAERTVRRVVPRGRRDDVKVRALGVPSEVAGPIRRGQRLGTAEVRQGGRRVETVALVAAAGVPEAGLVQKTKSWFTGPLAIVLAFAVLSATVLVARQLRRGHRPGRRAREEAPAA